MIRRISTKWVLAVLAVVVVPFVGFALFVDTKVTERLSDDVVQFHLLSMAADLASRLDEEIEERRQDVAILAQEAIVAWFLAGVGEDRSAFRSQVQRSFNGVVEFAGAYEFIVAIDAEGNGLESNTVDSKGGDVPESVLKLLRKENYARAENEWFRRAMRDGWALIDFHSVRWGDEGGREERDHYIGFVSRVDPIDGWGEPVGVVLTLMNWQSIQDEVSSYGIRQLASTEGHQVGEDIYESSYAWIWSSDADTIIAHKDPKLYGTRVSDIEGGELIPLVEEARSKDSGMFPDYEFRGVRKKAAFKRLKTGEEGGFGWVVGVGVDHVDIYAPVEELSRLLFTSSAIVLSLAVLFTFFIAHRTTRPILLLQQHTRRIAHGDLDARVDVGTSDELGELANAFNRMSTELKENREQLVKAEKDAAWREMARQVAHEIKNPLTPISISAGLLKRSHDEGSADFDSIFDRTIELIQRQVENMREITRDFYAFAGEHREPRATDLGQLLDDVLELHAAQAAEQAVVMHRSGTGGTVYVDPGEMRRALMNLVTNALEAMPGGGELFVIANTDGEEVHVEIRDTGPGLPPEVEARLFEPYFTTRSSGTGLGLAIVRRVIEDLGGSVSLENSKSGVGAVARIALPVHA